MEFGKGDCPANIPDGNRLNEELQIVEKKILAVSSINI
jgi:hypothetical protein